MRRRAAGPARLAVLAVLVSITVVSGAALAAVPVDENTVRQIAEQLRCVVCQNLSVADSPSETANQMRDIVRERLATGETPEQVKAYFVEKYGIWILLAPPKQGFTLLVWVLPFVGLLLGLGVVALVLRRWTRRARAGIDAAPALDETTRERIRQEMADIEERQ
jgi:cytochrome c-type biogenesis protein CcmH